jgi:type VI secretion system FHA domain protein
LWLPPVAGHAVPVPAPAAAAPFDQAGDSLAAASIVNVGGPFAASFDPGADPLGLNLAPPAAPSAGAAYRGAVSDHAPPEQAAFVMPGPAAMPAPAIPHDYDPLADLLARPAPAALRPAGSSPLFPPVPQPAPGPLPRPAPESVPLAASPAVPHPASPQGVEPDTEPAMRTILRPALQPDPPAVSPPVLPPVLPPAAAAAAVPAAMPAAADDSRVLQALLRGLGLPDLHSRRGAEELAELAGAMLREATAGTIGVLMARTLTKRESRVEMTMIAPQANNPLKFFPDAATALTHMLQGPLPGYLPPERAFAGAFVDLRAHELAVMAGTRAALAGVLRRFDPAAIEERLHEPGLLEKMFTASRKTRMWDQLVQLYGQLAVEADADFQRLFGEAFALAYEEQVRRLRDAGHSDGPP